MTELILSAGEFVLRMEIFATPTADLLLRILPFSGTARFWGRLVRIDVPIEAYLEPGATALAEVGDVLWSPEHDDVLIPYGATPISAAGEIRLPGPSTRIGRVLDDVQTLRLLQDGAMITIADANAVPKRRKPRGLADPRRGKGRWLG
jgi:hypothetical protein